VTIDPTVWTSRPAVTDGFGYLYVIEFDCKVVKVGKTVDPASRLAQHISDASAFRAELVAAWISDAHLGFARNETTIIDFMVRSSRGERARREYFYDADFDTTVALVELVCRGEDPYGQVDLFGGLIEDPEPTPIPKVLAYSKPLPTFRAIAATIAAQIYSGELAAGTWLPSLTEMQKQYQVDVAMARRVVAELRSQGLVTSFQGKGSVVRTLNDSPNEPGRPPNPDVSPDQMALVHHQLAEMKAELEIHAKQLGELAGHWCGNMECCLFQRARGQQLAA
jgi:DNA-binding transcriptional regulator YhcF (GntR family)